MFLDQKPKLTSAAPLFKNSWSIPGPRLYLPRPLIADSAHACWVGRQVSIEASRGRQAGSCVYHGQDMLLTPDVTNSERIQQLLCHTDTALADAEVLLCWRGPVRGDAFEVINDVAKSWHRDFRVAATRGVRLPARSRRRR